VHRKIKIKKERQKISRGKKEYKTTWEKLKRCNKKKKNSEPDGQEKKRVKGQTALKRVLPVIQKGGNKKGLEKI